MKKIAITLIVFLTAINLKAQQQFAGDYGFRLGLTAHPTFGFIKAEGGKGNGVSLGFSYGLIGDFNFAENYSFSTGVTVTTINGKSTEINAFPYFVTSGAAASSMLQSIPYDIKYRMQYIEIPLTIKLKTAEINGTRWFGQFGLSNDFRIGSKQDAESNGTELANNVNANDYTRFYRAGMIIGGGGEFSLNGKTSLLLGLTYNNGFTNISSLRDGIKNHYVAINFGAFF